MTAGTTAAKAARSAKAAKQRGALDARNEKDAAWRAMPQAERDAIRIGQKVRERQAAADVVATALALRATGTHLEDRHYLMADQETDAREVLAEAERIRQAAGRPGRIELDSKVQRMSVADLFSIANAAAGIELGAAAAKGYRPKGSERDELREDLAGHVVDQMLTRAAITSARAWFIAPYGTPASDAAHRRVERALEAEQLPAWDGLYPPSTRAEKAAAWRRSYRWSPESRSRARDLWLGWSRDHARHALYVARHQVEVTKELAKLERDEMSGAEQRAMRADAASDAANLTVDHLADVLAAAGRPLGKLERDGLTAHLDGLTHRERAERQGITAAHAKQNAAKGRTAMRARWGDDLAALADDIRDALALALAADLYVAANRRAPFWADARTVSLERARLAVLEAVTAALAALERVAGTRPAPDRRIAAPMSLEDAATLRAWRTAGQAVARHVAESKRLAAGPTRITFHPGASTLTPAALAAAVTVPPTSHQAADERRRAAWAEKVAAALLEDAHGHLARMDQEAARKAPDTLTVERHRSNAARCLRTRTARLHEAANRRARAGRLAA